MKKYLIIIVLLSCGLLGKAQTGSFSYTFIPKDGAAISKATPLPLRKYKDYDTYWYTHPVTGDHHLFVNGTADIGVIILDDHDDTDVDYKPQYHDDQLDLIIKTPSGIRTLTPDNDFGPVHIHYTKVSPGEIDLTFEGPASYEISTNSDYVHGRVSGHLHFYREPLYEKSDVMPGCNCDPTIYARSYDPETGRTPSACENALLWKVYNHVQQAFTGVVSNLAYSGNESPVPYGSIIYNPDHSNMDITGPLSGIEPCDANDKSRSKVSINAHSHLFTRDDYAIHFNEIINTDQFTPKGFNGQSYLKDIKATSDSLFKLYAAKRITADQMNKVLKEKGDSYSAGVPDIKKAEADYQLNVNILVNSLSHWDAMLGIVNSSNQVIQHNIPGAAFEIYSVEEKDDGGNWSSNALFIYFGKFTVVKEGNRVKSVTPVYNPTMNKLTAFNAIIKIKGGKVLIDKAITGIDFQAIKTLINDN